MGWSKLHQSFLLGNQDVTLMRIKDATKEECEEEYWSLTPLHLAICADYQEVFEALIEKGISICTCFDLKRFRWFIAWSNRISFVAKNNPESTLAKEFNHWTDKDNELSPQLACFLRWSPLINKIYAPDHIKKEEMLESYNPIALARLMNRNDMIRFLLSRGATELMRVDFKNLVLIEENKILQAVENHSIHYSNSTTTFSKEDGHSEEVLLQLVARDSRDRLIAKDYTFQSNGSFSDWLKKVNEIHSKGTLFNPNIENISKDLFIFLDRVLGEGSEGLVILGNFKGKRVAVKLFKELSGFEREMRLYQKAYHEKLENEEISFLPSVDHMGTKQQAIVMPCFEVGSLKGFLDFLSSKDKTLFPLNLRIRMGLDIAIGLESLHKKGIAHRDIKSANILLQPGLSPIFIDFGFANEVSDKSSELGACGTAEYMAPEIFEEKESPDLFKADVYSFSILLWELLSGNYPYTCGVGEIEDLAPTVGEYEELIEQRQRGIGLLKDCVTDGMRPTIDKMWGDGVKKILENCWNPNPAKRPDMKDVIEMIKRL